MTSRAAVHRVNVNWDMVGQEVERPGDLRWREFTPAEHIRSSGDWSGTLDRVFISKLYIVQKSLPRSCDDGRPYITLAIRRINGTPVLESWSGIDQIIKETCGHGCWALEAYPPTNLLVDDAPIRWIWVYPDGKPVLRHGGIS